MSILSEKFLSNYKNKQPNWGFNGLGYIVYKRTYARLKTDGTTEEWWETIKRCIDGAQEIGAEYTKEEAERLFDHVFNLRCCFAGRSLWQLGTDTVRRFGANSLINCFYTNIEELEDFNFVFENLMLGGGVTFSVRREHIHQLPKIKPNVKIEHKNTKDADFIVPDSREGWVELKRRVLQAFFVTGKGFTYSTILVRGYGEKIGGFGGTASGPQILIDGIENICKIFQSRESKKLRSIDVLDIGNIIGSIVVAGNVRRCLPETAMVHTQYGLQSIKDVKPGTKVLTFNGYSTVLNHYVQGKQKLVRIWTQDGYFDCTPHHRMAVLNSTNTYVWKTADTLTPDDRLITSRIPIEGQNQILPDWDYVKPEHSTTCQNINIPKLDTDMAWFIGVFQADGYTYANLENNGFNAYVSLVFGENEYSLAEKAKQQIERFGLNNVKLEHRKNENSWLVHCQSKQLATYLHQYIKQPKTILQIPNFIINNTKDIKLAYICGILDGDGSTKNRPVVVVSTVYKEFAENIQKLLYSCGLESRLKIAPKYPSRKENWQPQFFIYLITQYSKNILQNCGFLHKTILSTTKSNNANTLPVEFMGHYSNAIKRRFNSSSWNIDKYNSLCEKTNYCPCQVVRIENIEAKETYDIEVENNHEFYCNGYLTHNTAELALGDADDILFLRAKRWDLGNIPNWRAMSNNTIAADSYDYTSPEFWKGYNGDGEPYGLFNLELSQNYGRLIDGPMNKCKLYPQPKDNCEGTNPCSEISLASGESCNLSELFMNNINTLEEFIDCAKLLYKTQKAICALPYLHDKTTKIVHKNMRLGIGITGICQSLDKLNWLDKAYKEIRKFDKEWSKHRGWNESIKLTTTKPSGTLSLLSGSTPGVHPGFDKFYIRRVRMSSLDKLVNFCEGLGYKTEFLRNFDGTIDHKTVVVEFPCTCNNAIVAPNMSAIEQLELVKKIQTYWADNAVSVTVYYKLEELENIKKWLQENYKSNLKCVSFLLHSNHNFAQAPYESISQEQYLEFTKNIKPISTSPYQDTGGKMEVEECAGGACPIK